MTSCMLDNGVACLNDEAIYLATLKTNDGDIFYQIAGAGEPLVLLRGLGRSSRHWLGYEKDLGAHFQVICIDARGIGRSTKQPSWNLTIDDLADDVSQVLDKLNIAAAHIVGISLGGMVAMAFGHKYPERSKSLVIINSSVSGANQLRLTPSALLAIGKGGLKRTASNQSLARVLLAPAAPLEKLARLSKAWQRIERQEGVPVTAVLKQLLAASRFHGKDRLDKISVPTLVIYGANDQFVPVANSRFIHSKIRGAKLEVIENAGHELAIDQPQAMTKAICSFVNALSR